MSRAGVRRNPVEDDVESEEEEFESGGEDEEQGDEDQVMVEKIPQPMNKGGSKKGNKVAAEEKAGGSKKGMKVGRSESSGGSKKGGKSSAIAKKDPKGAREDDNRQIKMNGKLRKKSKHDKLDRFIYKLMKEPEPNFRISKQAMTVVNNFIQDILCRLNVEASHLSKKTSKGKGGGSLKARDANCAARLVLPGELMKLGVQEGAKAVSLYTGNPIGS